MGNEIIISSEASGSLHETPMAIRLGETFGLDPKQIIKVLQTQLIKVPSGKPPATPAELVVVMSTLAKYGLDPMMRQLYAWRDNRGDLACMLSLDGWVEIARRNPGYINVSYKYGPDVPKTGKHKACWEWVQATVHTRDRGPVELPPMYLDEWRKDYGQWLEMPRHKMHIIVFRMAIREVYGISLDVRDPDDIQAEWRRAEYTTAATVEEMAAGLAEANIPVTPVTVVAQMEKERLLAVVEDAEPNPEQPTSDAPEMDDEAAARIEEMKKAEWPILDPEPDRPCGIEGCEKTALHGRCGECGKYVCEAHMSGNGFQCMTCADKGGVE